MNQPREFWLPRLQTVRPWEMELLGILELDALLHYRVM